MEHQMYKIGDIARKTGTTIRTLRYYEEIGLLLPSRRKGSGYRLYGVEEVERLQKILSLKHIGLSLEEIKDCLNDETDNLENIIYRQLKWLRAEIELNKQLYKRLQDLISHIRQLKAAGDISADELFKTMKIMNMYEKYYSKEQLEYLKQRQEELGPEGMEEVSRQWQVLIEQVQAEMDNGTDPKSDKVQKLAAQWKSLIEEFTGGDSGIRKSLNTMYETEGHEKASLGHWNKEMSSYLQKALKG